LFANAWGVKSLTETLKGSMMKVENGLVYPEFLRWVRSRVPPVDEFENQPLAARKPTVRTTFPTFDHYIPMGPSTSPNSQLGVDSDGAPLSVGWVE